MDSAARAPMQGIIQFNGKFGCNWCFHLGKWVPNKNKVNSGSHKYPLEDTHVSRRTAKLMIQHMMTGMPSKPCFGVKNPSQLINMDEFDIIDGFVPEHLHMLSGIGKQFANVWFGSKNEASSLISKQEMDLINSIMLKIKAPC